MIEWFLDSSTSAHFILFESNFVNMTLSNYGQVETTKSKALLFMVTSSTVLIEHKIFDSKKETTKVAVSKLLPVYCVSGIQIHLLSTRQVLQFQLRVEGNESSSTFYDKSGDTVISATSNLWDNIQIVRTHILEHNIPNSMSLMTRYLDFETLHYCFGHAYHEVIHHVLDSTEYIKKICFPTQNCICYSYTLENMH